MRRTTAPRPRTRRPPDAFGLPASLAAVSALSAGSGRSPTATRAKAETTASRISVLRQAPPLL
eukprot:8958228-Alexandrium_andersonii.AAC.1